MKLTIPVKDLTKALATAAQVVAKKTTIPVLECVCLTAKGGTLQLDASDLEQYVSITTPATVAVEGSICVDAKKLHGYVNLLPHAEVSIDVSAASRVTVKCGKSRTVIGGISSANFVERPAPQNPVLYEIPGSWLTLIDQRVAFAIAAEQSRYTLMSALLEFNKNLKALATDGHRLTALTLKPAAPFTTHSKVLASKAAIAIAAKLFGASEKVALSIDSNHLFFEVAGCLLISRKLSGQFPDYERVLPRDTIYAVDAKREELQGCLSRVMRFANETSHAVRFAFNGELSLQVSDKDEADESLPFAGSASGHVGLNGLYVQDFLRAVGCDDVQMRLKGEQDAVEFREGGGDDSYRYVVMPMRV